jgi:hypothetical protein
MSAGNIVPAPLGKEEEIAAFLDKRRHAKYIRFVASILGAIPWVGAFIAASAALHAEQEQGHVTDLHRAWMAEHAQKFEKLNQAVTEMKGRLDQIGGIVEERLEDETYLGLVRTGFRIWDESPTGSTRGAVQRTLTNAAGTKLCSDDVVRLFLLWLRTYDELHLRVIRFVYENAGATRAEIWDAIHGVPVREDSPEADLFKLMIRDLSTGSVIRQHRDTTDDGRFLVKSNRSRGARRLVMKSAFADGEEYELTGLGRQFVHYAFNALVPRIESGERASGVSPQTDGIGDEIGG